MVGELLLEARNQVEHFFGRGCWIFVFRNFRFRHGGKLEYFRRVVNLDDAVGGRGWRGRFQITDFRGVAGGAGLIVDGPGGKTGDRKSVV